MKFEEKLAQRFQRSCSKLWTDGQWTDNDRWQVITIAYPEPLVQVN